MKYVLQYYKIKFNRFTIYKVKIYQLLSKPCDLRVVALRRLQTSIIYIPVVL